MKFANKISLSIWSCHRYLYNKTWTNTDFIRFARRETMADGVELLYRFLESAGDVNQIEKTLQQENLQVACVSASNNFALPTEEDRRMQLQQVLSSVDYAAAFGANVVRVFSGSHQEGEVSEQARQWIINGLKEAAEYAGKRNIVLCLENHGQFAGKASQVKSIIEEVDSLALRSTFDMGNFLLADENPRDAMVQLHQVIGHVHCKDFIKVSEDFQGDIYPAISGELYTGTIIGEGSVELGHLLTSLRDSGFGGWISVEFEGNEEQRLGSTRSVSNIKQLINSL
ncbi:sugar phosphate isomerase/epimerase family protein [Paenibacillus aestuarii]|uniref:Sugar phosphate isomerase/epimerase n=1 Tax=Paenibacillus aestuarii TaxID=516965 RepID=A0ABW0K3K5_9BACL|nr:sugar phosphate isomerase/epimerase [Paenibacillus aestuarii]